MLAWITRLRQGFLKTWIVLQPFLSLPLHSTPIPSHFLPFTIHKPLHSKKIKKISENSYHPKPAPVKNKIKKK